MLPAVLTIIIIVTDFVDNYLLFHTLAESFSIFVALSIGLISYNTYSFTQNRYFLFIGLAYIWVGILDLFHTFTFPTMNIFQINGLDTTLTIWVLTRLFEAIILLIAVFIHNKKFNPLYLSIFFFIFAFLVCSFAFYSPMKLFIQGEGLSSLKNNIEYLVIAILILTLILNKIHSNRFTKSIYRSIQIAIFFTILAELSFTTYVMWDGLPSLLGHVFKFLSFWIIFESVVKFSLSKPMELLSNDATSYNAIPIPSIVVSKEGIILQINKAVVSELKISSKNILNQSNHKLLHFSHVEEQDCVICKYIKACKDTNSLEMHDPSTNSYYKFTISNISNNYQNMAMIQVREDITETKLLELEKNTQLLVNAQIYEDLFYLNTSIILLIDPKNGNILNANRSALNFYGYSKSELLVLNISDINHNISKSEIKNNITLIMNNNNKTNHYFSVQHTLSNNETRNVKAYTNPSKYKGEAVIIATIVDVTDEITAKTKLVEIEHKFKNIFEFANIGLVLRDIDGLILDINNKLLSLLGYSDKEDFLGQSCEAFVKAPNEPDNNLFFIDLINKKIDHFSTELKLQKKDGSLIDTYITTNLFEIEKNVTYILTSVIDITKIKQKDDLIAQQSKMAAMGEMIENITHQWRQPLSVISTAVTGIKFKEEINDLNKEDLIHSMDVINTSVQQQAQTITDFRDFFKVDKVKKEFTLISTFEKTFKLISSQFKTANISIIKNIEDIVILEMENELIQVFINIINNARDELIKKEDKKFIFINAIQRKNYIEISFKDNAGGIPKEIIEDVFNSHFTTKQDSNGTGIGLYMSKMIIEENMKGKIEVENISFSYEDTNYKGAQFKIILPVN